MLEGFAKFNLVQLSSRFLQWQNGHLHCAERLDWYRYVEMHYGTVLERKVVFGWLSHFCAENWIKIRPLGQFHSAVRNATDSVFCATSKWPIPWVLQGQVKVFNPAKLFFLWA